MQYVLCCYMGSTNIDHVIACHSFQTQTHFLQTHTHTQIRTSLLYCHLFRLKIIAVHTHTPLTYIKKTIKELMKKEKSVRERTLRLFNILPYFCIYFRGKYLKSALLKQNKVLNAETLI